MTVPELIEPLQKRLNQIIEGFSLRQVYREGNEGRVYGTFEQSYDDFIDRSLEKGISNITKIGFYEDAIEKINDIEACLLNFEKVHNVKIKMLKDTRKAKYFAEQLIQKEVNNKEVENKIDKASYQREIQIDRLKDYFVPSFIRAGENETNYFTENFIPELQKRWDGKHFAAIASLVYNSDKLRKRVKPNSFAKWLSVFCELVDVKNSKYKQSKLLDTCTKLKDTFYYL